MAPKAQKKTLGDALRNAGKRALGGGLAGAIAMVVQVLALMWMRTTINYQHAKGMSTLEAMAVLYAAGGIARFYQGMSAALLQAPLSRPQAKILQIQQRQQQRRRPQHLHRRLIIPRKRLERPGRERGRDA